jgi:hypothetical protein
MALACPRCGLKNPSTAQQCDCGHRFIDDAAEQRSASPSASREARHCDNSGRTLGALERGLQRDGHFVCVECAPRLDAEHRSARRTKPWPKLVAALAVAVTGAGAVLARHLAHNGGDDCQQAAHKIASRVSAEMGSSNEFDEAGYAAKCRDRTNPRHLTAAHYRKEIDCVLKADSDDALIECMKMSEVREASLILNTIGHAVAGIVQRSHNIPLGNASSTSTRDLCAIAHREVRPDWSADLWRAMHIDFMERPEQFDNPQYAVTYEGDANGFHVEAVGDTDCNGRAATWKLDGKLVNGELETTAVDLLPAEARLVHQDRAAANTSMPGLGSESSGAAPTLAPIPPQTPSSAAANANNPNDHGTDTHAQVKASSTHTSAAGYSFSAANLFDADLTTCWQADRGDKSPWVQVEFDAPIMISAIKIANGFQITDKFGDEFVLNSRIADGRIRFSDNAEVTIHFEADERGFITFTMPAKSTRSLRLIVDKTYRGTRWNDLAVSEISIVGDGNGLADAAKWPGPTPPGRERQENDSRKRPKANANIPIGCHEWFEMNASDQADMAAAVGKRVQAEYERDHSRRVVVAPGDYAALANAFTAGCKGGAKEDLYTVAKLTMEVAFANQ